MRKEEEKALWRLREVTDKEIRCQNIAQEKHTYKIEEELKKRIMDLARQT